MLQYAATPAAMLQYAATPAAMLQYAAQQALYEGASHRDCCLATCWTGETSNTSVKAESGLQQHGGECCSSMVVVSAAAVAWW